MTKCIPLLLIFFITTLTSPAFGIDRVDVMLEKAEIKPVAKGVEVVVSGTARGAPDATKIRVRVFMAGGTGLRERVQVEAGKFNITMGPYPGKLLPGSYQIEAVVDEKQRGSIAARLKKARLVPGRKVVIIGTLEEAKLERDKLRQRYIDLMVVMGQVYGEVSQWGSNTVARAMVLKVQKLGKIPKSDSKRVLDEWNRFSTSYRSVLATLRFDLKQVKEYVFLGYYPRVETQMVEILTTLSRYHGSYAVATYENLGLKPPKDVAAEGAFSLNDSKGKLPRLATQVYQQLKHKGEPWVLTAMGAEKSSDAEGDLFRSTVSRFEVKKPGPTWMFDLNSPSPSMRIRIRLKDKKLNSRIVSGVELRDWPMAENFQDLARLDEMYTRNHWPGFELIKRKKLRKKDPTMPNGFRRGMAMKYKINTGKASYTIFQYALFCRWHKRTYSIMSFAESALYKEWEETFDQINESFNVLDKPKKPLENLKRRSHNKGK